MNINTDLLIIGCGSAGFGAALSAGRIGGVKVTVAETNDAPGGTSTFAGVNCWEPGVGGEGIHREIAAELISQNLGAVGVYTGEVSRGRPYSLSLTSPDFIYESTLKRAGTADAWSFWRFQFEPDAMKACMDRKLRECGVDLHYNTEFTGLDVYDGVITCVKLKNRITGKIMSVNADIVIDCTGDICAARAAGCRTMVGEDAKRDFGEYSAPDERSDLVNGVSLIFRVSPAGENFKDTIPQDLSDIDVGEWYRNQVIEHRVYSQCNVYPNGDINVNMLPTMEGVEYMRLGAEKALPVMKARVYRYLQWLQTEKGFHYRMKEIFSETGVRETRRLFGRYVLTENEIRKSYAGQERREEVIAFADHILDTHGSSNISIKLPSMTRPYGIPYSCLLPNEVENLLVACRGASFSHIALSSCRLSRTMISIGEAAGTAAVLALTNSHKVSDINIKQLRKLLKIVDI